MGLIEAKVGGSDQEKINLQNTLNEERITANRMLDDLEANLAYCRDKIA
jgi:hypothetical protein